MSPPRRVRFCFDFISPYSYLALTQAETFAAAHDVEWDPRPVFYAALLDATGLIGPAEVPSKRAYSLRDIVRAADLLGVPLVGPPAHPFNSLAALRAACAFGDDPRALALSWRLATACWGEGRDLTEPEVVAAAVTDVGLDASGLAERIASPAVKVQLKANTDEALAAGVFGVPTFQWNAELFWGHDRLEHLGARLDGRLGSPEERGATIAGRPRASDRPQTAARFGALEGAPPGAR